jgi:hypothetical protein
LVKGIPYRDIAYVAAAQIDSKVVGRAALNESEFCNLVIVTMNGVPEAKIMEVAESVLKA